MPKMAKSDEGMAKREGMLSDNPELVKEVSAIFGDTLKLDDPPAEPVAAPTPGASADERPAEVTPPGTPEADTTDYKAEALKLRAEREADREEWQRQREGMVAALAGKRRERREAHQQPLSQAQQTSAASQGIALKWNEKGEAFIDPASMAALRMPEDEIERRIEARVNERLAPMEQERLRTAILSEDPARLTPILGELDFAYRHLDSMVQFKQQEMDARPFSGVEEAVNFIEYSGVADKFRAQYPHIAPDRESIREFVLSANRPNAETVKAFVRKVADRKSPVQNVAASAPTAFEPPPQSLDPNKPRSHADRGGKAPANEGNSMERELSDLSDKASKQGAWSLSDPERERLGWLTRTLSKRKAS